MQRSLGASVVLRLGPPPPPTISTFMNSFATIFLLVNAVALVSLSRRLAPLPLLVGVCYITVAQVIEIGPLSFTVVRILIAVGFVRILIRGERITGGMNQLDWLMVTFSAWVLFTSFFRPDVVGALVFRLGFVFNTFGIYFLIRIFCQSMEDLWRLLCITAFLLLPIGIEMIYEHLQLHNLFSAFGGVSAIPAIRDGNIRAQGPFRHPILAGTVGAVCMPLMVALWNKYRKAAVVGIVSCVAMVYCSSSSGPLVSLLAGIGGLSMWLYRDKMKLVRWVAVLGYVALALVMKAPPYYLMARIPLMSGSTGWHRAALINSAIRHLNEWWLWGTDYTRHWMPTGVSWSPDHADITNHYIKMGVLGGLPMMMLFILILAKGFSFVGQSLQKKDTSPPSTLFMIWSVGASLFANAATMTSVSYFDQSFVFLYFTLAAIGSVWSVTVKEREKEIFETK